MNMSLNYFSNPKYQISPEKYYLESLENKLRKEIHQFEFSSLKSKRKILSFQKNKLLPFLNKVKDYENKIKGFNIEAFIISIAILHTAVIYRRKVLLNEMGRSKAINYMAFLVLFGTLNAFLFGYHFAKSFSLYRCYKQTYSCIKKLNDDFDFYYISKNEQEFDD